MTDTTLPKTGWRAARGSGAQTDGRGEAPGPRRSEKGTSLELLERFGLLGLFVVVVIGFSIWKPDTFPTSENFRIIASSQSVVAVAALALMFPLIGGRFDVSVGAILGASAIATASVMSKYGVPFVLAILIGVALGSAIGLLNGIIVVHLGVNSIIGTLGMSTIVAGVITAYTSGVPVTNGLSPSIVDLGLKDVLGVPYLFLVMLVVSVVAWYVLTQTPYGRQLVASGSNLRAAGLSGMPVKRIIWISFVCSGMLGGIAGVLQLASQGNGDPAVGGIGIILPAIAAVFLGATTWRPGQFNVPGTLLALFFVGATISGLTLVGAAPWVTDVFNGTAIIVAIALAAQFRKRRTGSLEIGM